MRRFGLLAAHVYGYRSRIGFAIILCLFIALSTRPAWAFSQEDLYSVNTNTAFSDPSDTTGDCSTSSDTSVTTGVGGGSFTLDQVKTFASEPVTSTWNISDSTAEQWFLQNDHNHAAKYSLNAGNIGKITAAVKAAGVSPAFFYLDANEEGTGAGGFINHYPTDVAGGGVANATRDAKYIASESQTTADGPAAGGGEPSDMPTAEAKAFLSSLPKGSLGVYYIQATAPVTAEVETLSGKTGDWSGKYNSPFEDLMNNIKKSLGGDPLQGGATISSDDCGGSVVGEGMAKGISFALFIAKDNGYGYDQQDDSNQTLPGAARTTGWARYRSDPSCTHQCGSFDCSSFVSAILTVAGYFSKNPEFDTSSEPDDLQQAGFKKIASSAHTSRGLQAGDVLIKDNDHTEMYIGNGKDVRASQNEFAGINGGKVGDQTGSEISVVPFYDDGWDAVYRAPN